MKKKSYRTWVVVLEIWGYFMRISKWLSGIYFDIYLKYLRRFLHSFKIDSIKKMNENHIERSRVEWCIFFEWSFLVRNVEFLFKKKKKTVTRKKSNVEKSQKRSSTCIREDKSLAVAKKLFSIFLLKNEKINIVVIKKSLNISRKNKILYYPPIRSLLAYIYSLYYIIHSLSLLPLNNTLMI